MGLAGGEVVPRAGIAIAAEMHVPEAEGAKFSAHGGESVLAWDQRNHR